MDYIQVQAQDLSGVWRTYQNVLNSPQRILIAMQELQRNYPSFRIRAVDSAGRIVDIL